MIELEFSIISYSKVLGKHPYGKMIGSISGDVIVNIERLPNLLSRNEFGEEITDALGAYVSGILINSDGVGLVVNTGNDFVELEFTSEHLLAVNISIPIKIKEIDLSKLTLQSQVKGKISIEITLEITFFPNIKLLASKGARQAIKLGKYAAKNAVTKGIRGVKIITRHGINAINRVVMARLEKIASKIAIDITLRGLTQIASLRKIVLGWVKWASRIAGVAGIYLDIYLSVQLQLENEVKRRGAKTQDFIAKNFRFGYASLLATMTEPERIAITKRDIFFEKGGKLQLLQEDPPDFINTVTVFAATGELTAPKSKVNDWVKKIEKNGPSFHVVEIKYLEIEVNELIAEAFNSYWVFHDYSGTRVQAKLKNANKMVDHARTLSYIAGEVAAYNEILSYIIASRGMLNDKGEVDLNTIWYDWDEILVAHQIHYGNSLNARLFKYIELAEKAGSYYPRVIPFR